MLFGTAARMLLTPHDRIEATNWSLALDIQLVTLQTLEPCVEHTFSDLKTPEQKHAEWVIESYL